MRESEVCVWIPLCALTRDMSFCYQLNIEKSDCASGLAQSDRIIWQSADKILNLT
jgi:hypothetical protein